MEAFRATTRKTGCVRAPGWIDSGDCCVQSRKRICCARSASLGKSVGVFWTQRHVQLPAKTRGMHLITSEVVSHVPEVVDMTMGILHVFVQHTSAALTLNENADPDVRTDLASFLTDLVPETYPFRHTCEGPDDMPAHVTSSLLGASVSIPISDGRLALGTWQGIYLAEFRNHAASRTLILTLHGEQRPSPM